MIRAGGFELTDQAMETCQFQTKSNILDVGCGSGETVAYLKEKYGFHVCGIDTSLQMISLGKEKDPSLNIMKGDGEALDFPSKSFEGVLMECSLSLIPNPTEALHEAYCVLKNNGKLIITDLYIKNPDKKARETMEKIKNAHQNRCEEDGDCESYLKNRVSDCCVDGAFIKEELLDKLSEVGFSNVSFEDRTQDLTSFFAEAIFTYGTLEEFWNTTLPKGVEKTSLCGALSQKGLGYFLLIAQK